MKKLLPLLLLTACPDPASPDRLWIALDDGAAMLRLVDDEPDPF